jgi:hypothetical protein
MQLQLFIDGELIDKLPIYSEFYKDKEKPKQKVMMMTTIKYFNMHIQLSKRRPILFSTPMVKAILEGRKTETRRVIKDPGWRDNGFEPKLKVGNILWVRETFKPKYVKEGLEGFKKQYPGVCPWFYAADGESEPGYGGWKPSIFMPREASRILLQVTDVTPQRLIDISTEDTLNEGINYWNVDWEMFEGGELVADY